MQERLHIVSCRLLALQTHDSQRTFAPIAISAEPLIAALTPSASLSAISPWPAPGLSSPPHESGWIPPIPLRFLLRSSSPSAPGFALVRPSDRLPEPVSLASPRLSLRFPPVVP